MSASTVLTVSRTPRLALQRVRQADFFYVCTRKCHFYNNFVSFKKRLLQRTCLTNKPFNACRRTYVTCA